MATQRLLDDLHGKLHVHRGLDAGMIHVAAERSGVLVATASLRGGRHANAAEYIRMDKDGKIRAFRT